MARRVSKKPTRKAAKKKSAGKRPVKKPAKKSAVKKVAKKAAKKKTVTRKRATQKTPARAAITIAQPQQRPPLPRIPRSSLRPASKPPAKRGADIQNNSAPENPPANASDAPSKKPAYNGLQLPPPRRPRRKHAGPKRRSDK